MIDTFTGRLISTIYRPYHQLRSSNRLYQLHQQQQLHQVFPFLLQSHQQSKETEMFLKPYYRQYVNEVSSPSMAVSLKLAVFMTILCNGIKPKNILDLGSGFSSFVLRTYAAHHNEVTVWSIDDSSEWLERTKNYLKTHNLSIDHMMLWHEFCQDSHFGLFDLVFHDMGSMTLRHQVLEKVLRMGRDVQSVILLDDVHKPLYARHLHHSLDRRSYRYFDLILNTLDDEQRYCGLVIPKTKL